jgi:hypothetical protein
MARSDFRMVKIQSQGKLRPFRRQKKFHSPSKIPRAEISCCASPHFGRGEGHCCVLLLRFLRCADD